VVPPDTVMSVSLMVNRPNDTSSSLDASVATRTSMSDTRGVGSVTALRFSVARVCTVCHTLVPGSNRAMGPSCTAGCQVRPPSTLVSIVTVDPTAGVDCSQWMTLFVIGDCGMASGGLIRNPVSGVNTCGAASTSFGEVDMVKCVWVFGMDGVTTTPASVSFGDVVIDTVTSGFWARNSDVPPDQPATDRAKVCVPDEPDDAKFSPVIMTPPVESAAEAIAVIPGGAVRAIPAAPCVDAKHSNVPPAVTVTLGATSVVWVELKLALLEGAQVCAKNGLRTVTAQYHSDNSAPLKVSVESTAPLAIV
jgi:hypothetical protein